MSFSDNGRPSMNKERKAWAQGFSLLEVLITVFLLVTGVVAVVKVLATGTAFDYSVECKVVASQLAQEEMEAVKNSSSFSDIDSKAHGKAPVASFSEYQSEVLISSGTDFKVITVNVYWTAKDVEEKVTLQTLLTNLAPSS